MNELVRIDPAIAPLEEREPPPWQLYLRALRNRRRALLLGALLGGAAAWSVAALRQPVYTAVTTLEMRAPNEAFLGLDGVSREAARSVYPHRSELQTNIRLLEARMLVRQTRDELLQSGRNIDGPLLEASDSLEVRADDESRILEVRSEASDPVVAAAFVNRLSENFIASQMELKLAEAEETRSWIDGQLVELRDRLEGSESKLQDYVAQHGLLHAAEEDASGWERLRALERELDAAKAGEARQRILAELASEDSDSAILDQTRSLEARRAELAQLKQRYAELDALYKPEHYQVKQVAAQIRSVEESLASEEGRLQKGARHEHAVSVRLVQALERQYREARESMAGDQQKGVEYEILRREAEANRELYDTFLTRAHQAGLAAAAPTPLVRIVDPALPPPAPRYPNAPLAGGAGLVFGLAMTAAWAVARERLDRTFHRPGELSSRLRLRELGAVPDVSTLQLDRQGTVAEVAMESSRRPVEILTADPESPPEIAESFRSVRSSLLRDISEADAAGVYVITSPVAGDGKTTVATNLAIAMAELDQPTLLVDADLRQPRLHRNFGLINRNGLADLLLNPDAIDDVLDVSIRPAPETPNLWLLPAGVVVQGGRGMLHTARMRALLDRLRKRFPTVIVDSPPIIAVSDARALARWADRVALIVRADHTPPEAVLEAVDTLTADGAPLIGTILNSWNPQKARRHIAYDRKAA
ncbi:MAG: polysaccharide biosynthesis tyrosine autokinase [Bryobacterales bacterium]|nr:polysaccharide biosynthesis tyrosine autokinase [Bryobacterales bacterium]